MIRSFADAETERFFTTGKTRKLPGDIFRRATMRLRQLDAATRIGDLRLPPSNRLEALQGKRAGQHSIRINDQCVHAFASATATRSMLKLLIIIEERTHEDQAAGHPSR